MPATLVGTRNLVKEVWLSFPWNFWYDEKDGQQSIHSTNKILTLDILQHSRLLVLARALPRQRQIQF